MASIPVPDLTATTPDGRALLVLVVGAMVGLALIDRLT